ncbi:UTRA domain-containing protein [Micromonospora sp. NPDC049523]|uniref:UTRA domain-containing protein n=1 Tax=Micromonospora sp. NPDC049523 TaxID=3155921 RepID=UPI003441983F
MIRSDHYPRPAPDGQPYPWVNDPSRNGQTGSSQLIAVDERPAPMQVAAAFGINKGEPVVMRHQSLLLDGEPVELVWFRGQHRLRQRRHVDCAALACFKTTPIKALSSTNSGWVGRDNTVRQVMRSPST